MASLSLFSSYSLISTLLLFFQHFLAVRSQQVETLLSWLCLNERGNFTANSTFAANLNQLVSSTLPSLPLNPSGYYNVSVGENTDRVNSVLLCRGDVKPEKCISCIVAASETIRVQCPDQKEAIIWYDNCIMRYTNRPISNVRETSPELYMRNHDNFKGDVSAIESALNYLLQSLRYRAARGGTQKKYAVNSVKVPSFQTLYAMVQCMPYLSQLACSNCLSEIIESISVCCENKIGGRWYKPSCFFRYEYYQFYNSVAVEQPAPSPLHPPPPSATETAINGEGKKQGDNAVVVIVVPIAVAFLIIVFIIVFMSMRRKNKRKQRNIEGEDGYEIINADSLLFDFGVIQDATDNFSHANTLGQGGFGTVYKGVLPDGQQIAAKRLSRNTGQGETEFKNEVLLVAKLQHRNLVKLLGFSIHGTERILVYEFVENSSLDGFIFDRVKRSYLDWSYRYRIIGGIARGLVYLHEDSHLRIIHRDLKASNILLNEEMTPKIADFGMARLFDIDQSTQRFTKRIVGTFGYMAPEYAMHGQFSFKTDVYSFGVLVLEIISGQKNNSFKYGEDVVEDLVTVAWKNWEKSTPLNLVDPSLTSGSTNEMLRCITIALLCVQENVADRPNMASVVLMLNSNSVTLPAPSQPASIRRFRISQMSSSENDNSRECETRSLQLSAGQQSFTELEPR